jgi:fluoride exporter
VSNAYLWVALGSAIGGMARFWISSQMATTAVHLGFPAGTLLINVAGSFVIGVASGWMEAQTVRWFVMTGLCGGFTTFSAFSLELLQLSHSGQSPRAFGYALASVGMCLGGVAAGSMIARLVRGSNLFW